MQEPEVEMVTYKRLHSRNCRVEQTIFNCILRYFSGDNISSKLLQKAETGLEFVDVAFILVF